jgi:hypothetical protein
MPFHKILYKKDFKEKIALLYFALVGLPPFFNARTLESSMGTTLEVFSGIFFSPLFMLITGVLYGELPI